MSRPVVSKKKLAAEYRRKKQRARVFYKQVENSSSLDFKS